RRHTRFSRDWSSDVCSSDLPEERYEIPVAGNPSIGPSDAPITIVEFSDFRCPYCARFAKETLRPLLESYGDQIQFVYRDFVIFEIGRASCREREWTPADDAA